MPNFTLSEDKDEKSLSIATVKDGFSNKFLTNNGPSYDKAVEVLQKDCAIIPTGILPDGVEWMSTDRRFVVWTLPPKRHVVDYVPLTLHDMAGVDSSYIEKRTRSYALPIPYHSFIIHLDANYCLANAYFFISYRVNFIPGDSDLGKACIPPLHNLYGDGRICFSKHSLELFQDREKFPTIHDILLGVYDAFWNSTLNNDTTEAYYNLAGTASSGTGLKRLRLARLGQTSNDMMNPNQFYSNWQRLSLKEATSSNVLGFLGLRAISVAAFINLLSPQLNDNNYHHVMLWYKITSAMTKANDLVAGNTV